MSKKPISLVFLLWMILSYTGCQSSESPVESVPSEVISKVELHLYVYGLGDVKETNITAPFEDKILNIHMAMEKWQEDQSTWNERLRNTAWPVEDGVDYNDSTKPFVSFVVSDRGAQPGIDITNIYNLWQSGVENYGLEIDREKLRTDSSYAYVKFFSKESLGPPKYRSFADAPYLVITYSDYREERIEVAADTYLYSYSKHANIIKGEIVVLYAGTYNTGQMRSLIKFDLP